MLMVTVLICFIRVKITKTNAAGESSCFIKNKFWMVFDFLDQLYADNGANIENLLLFF